MGTNVAVRSFRKTPQMNGCPLIYKIRASSISNFNLFSSSILGFNGAGKSNLFQAIQLCLADAQYDKMSTQERIALLHEVRLQQFEKKKINFGNFLDLPLVGEPWI